MVTFLSRTQPQPGQAVLDGGRLLGQGGGMSSAPISKPCHASVWQPLTPPPQVVLVAPEIPPNTGNIARLCAGLKAPLHLIEPLGFRLDDTHLRRAGLDYWPYVTVTVHRDWSQFLAASRPARLWFFSTAGERSYDAVRYAPGDALVFGSETRGLPADWRAAYPGRWLHIPQFESAVRSLNLANAVAVVLYEAYRQAQPGGPGSAPGMGDSP